ncbi:hypothetical protein PHYPSEUDO_012736 [Phytophthora pseudosyringae]|uniref:Uncharacterized protein n=1 Tax=Phytophthora pseudosyringae TaxID=221518 RepID=A0A8T1VB68_9STRA|nr:hypothetical protein PHYPSEUDO_012736 [Phytophthora pseudosyringae]
MSRCGYRSTSLFPQKSANCPVRQRICNSAPTTRVISDQEEDWDWGEQQAQSDSTASQQPGALRISTSDDKFLERVYEANVEGSMRAIGEVDIPVWNQEQPTRCAGGFTDFMDPFSSDSENGYLEDSGSDEPYEYWTTRKSYSPSPFSNSGSLSFEDSDDDEEPPNTSKIDNRTSTESIDCTPSLTISPSIFSSGLSRYSDLGPSVTRGWTAMIYGGATFEGPTSI